MATTKSSVNIFFCFLLFNHKNNYYNNCKYREADQVTLNDDNNLNVQVPNYSEKQNSYYEIDSP